MSLLRWEETCLQPGRAAGNRKVVSGEVSVGHRLGSAVPEGLVLDDKISGHYAGPKHGMREGRGGKKQPH